MHAYYFKSNYMCMHTIFRATGQAKKVGKGACERDGSEVDVTLVLREGGESIDINAFK